jgi:signal transduction histidine kinase
MFWDKKNRLLKKRLKRAQKKVAILEKMMETRTRDLYLSQNGLIKTVEELEVIRDELGQKTVDLSKSRDATLNMLEDLQETKEEIEHSNVELKNAKEEIETFSKELEKKVRERTYELSTLYEVSNAISYTLDHQQLLKLIMESLFKIVKYDACATLLFDKTSINFTFKPSYAEATKFIDEVRENIYQAASTIAGEDLSSRVQSSFSMPRVPEAAPKENRELDQIRSFFNVPFIVQGVSIGMLNVSSCKANAFTEDDIKIMYTIANQASNAIERLQVVVSAERTKMTSMVESMLEGVIMIDNRGDLVLINPSARYMLNFTEGVEIDSGQIRERFRNLSLEDTIRESLERTEFTSKDVTVSAFGETVLRCIVSSVRDSTGLPVGTVVTMLDITREKEIDRMKSEFVSTVSHELKTPLSITKEGISLVLDKVPGKINAKQARILTSAKDNIDRLARIINNLLDISKIEAQRVELKRRVVDIVGIAKQVVLSFDKFVADKGLKIRLDVPDKKTELSIDEDLITEVFTNLISNAIKYTDKGEIQVSVVEMETAIECIVSDTGRGVSKDDMPKLFNKFQQFGRVQGGGEKGTGLGLSIAKGIVELHKGKIWAESTPNKGSTFTFILPKHLEK